MRILSGFSPSRLPALVQRIHAALDAQRRDAGAPGMVLEQRRRAPEGHHAVADELVDRAVLLVDGLGDQLEIGRHAQQQLLATASPRTGVEKASRSEKKMVRKRLWPPSSSFCSDCRSWRDQADRHEGGERLHRGIQRVDRLATAPTISRIGELHRRQLLGAQLLDLGDLEGEPLERCGDHAGEEIDDDDLQRDRDQAEERPGGCCWLERRR